MCQSTLSIINSDSDIFHSPHLVTTCVSENSPSDRRCALGGSFPRMEATGGGLGEKLYINFDSDSFGQLLLNLKKRGTDNCGLC